MSPELARGSRADFTEIGPVIEVEQMLSIAHSRGGLSGVSLNPCLEVPTIVVFVELAQR
jgi:hypothetical protein